MTDPRQRAHDHLDLLLDHGLLDWIDKRLEEMDLEDAELKVLYEIHPEGDGHTGDVAHPARAAERYGDAFEWAVSRVWGNPALSGLDKLFPPPF